MSNPKFTFSKLGIFLKKKRHFSEKTHGVIFLKRHFSRKTHGVFSNTRHFSAKYLERLWFFPNSGWLMLHIVKKKPFLPI